jgi:hypothetical protein
MNRATVGLVFNRSVGVRIRFHGAGCSFLSSSGEPKCGEIS